jgi:hypothetical protein
VVLAERATDMQTAGMNAMASRPSVVVICDLDLAFGAGEANI